MALNVAPIPLRLLTQRALWTRTSTTSLNGQHAQTVVTLATAQPCRVSPLNTKPSKGGGLDMDFGADTVAQNFVAIYLAPGTVVERNDVFTVAGAQYRVLSNQAPSLPQHMKVIAEEVQRVTG